MHNQLSEWEVKHNGQQSFSLAFESVVDQINHKRLLKTKKSLHHQTTAVRASNTEAIRNEIANS